MANLAARLVAALKAAGVPVESVSIGKIDDRTTWKVTTSAPGYGAAVTSVINGFTENDAQWVNLEAGILADHALTDAELSATIWTMLVLTNGQKPVSPEQVADARATWRAKFIEQVVT
jgi:hydrogenase maturation factor HypE